MSTQDLEARVKKIEETTAGKEREAALAKANAIAERESLLFLQRHLPGSEKPYLNVVANTNLLAEFIKTNKLPWTAQSLEEAFEALSSKLAQPNAPEPKEQEPKEEKWPYPWPESWNSVAGIRSAEPQAYKSFWYSQKYNSPKQKVTFRQWVDEVLARGK